MNFIQKKQHQNEYIFQTSDSEPTKFNATISEDQENENYKQSINSSNRKDRKLSKREILSKRNSKKNLNELIKPQMDLELEDDYQIHMNTEPLNYKKNVKPMIKNETDFNNITFTNPNKFANLNQKKSEENETIVKSNKNSDSNNSNSNKNYSQNNFLKNHQKNLLNISNKEFDSNHNFKKEILNSNTFSTINYNSRTPKNFSLKKEKDKNYNNVIKVNKEKDKDNYLNQNTNELMENNINESSNLLENNFFSNRTGSNSNVDLITQKSEIFQRKISINEKRKKSYDDFTENSNFNTRSK